MRLSPETDMLRKWHASGEGGTHSMSRRTMLLVATTAMLVLLLAVAGAALAQATNPGGGGDPGFPGNPGGGFLELLNSILVRLGLPPILIL